MRLFFIFLLLWLVSGLIFDLHKLFLPELTGVTLALISEISNGALISNLLATFGRVLSGLAIAASVGLPLGYLIGKNKLAYRELMPVIDFLRGIPTSLLFPVFIVALGVGEISKAFIIATAVFPILVISTVIGISPRPEIQDRRDYIEVHKVHLGWKTRLFSLLWDALPPLVSGVKTSISIALVLTIVTEMFFVASSGVGWAAHQAYLSFELDLMYGYVIIVGVIGLLLNQLFDLSQNRVISAKANSF